MSVEKPPLSKGQKVAVAVFLIGVGAVFLAVCFRAVVWILGVA